MTNDDSESPRLPELVYRSIDQIELPFINDANNENLQQLLKTQARTNAIDIIQEPLEFVEQLLEYLPIMVLVFIPLLALVQKVIYLGSGRYYIEHLILTIHNQSFLFFTGVVLTLLGYMANALPWLASTLNPVSSVLYLWIVVYLFLSYKRFFQQTWLVTMIRFLLVFSVCLLVVLMGLLLF